MKIARSPHHYKDREKEESESRGKNDPKRPLMAIFSHECATLTLRIKPAHPH
jgi:hypothetical protein